MYNHTFNRTLAIAVATIGILAALQTAPVLTPASAQNVAPQPAPSLEGAAAELIIDAPGQMLELGSGPIDANIVITGAAGGVLVPPGNHVINGNLTLEAERAKILIGFSKDKQCGQIEVHGTMNLSQEHKPTLALDLDNVNLVPGETFVILTADAITGEFAGMGNDVAVQIGDKSITLHYTNNEISFSVSRPRDDWKPRVTPVFELDTDLIDPTSTAPSMW